MNPEKREEFVKININGEVTTVIDSSAEAGRKWI